MLVTQMLRVRVMRWPALLSHRVPHSRVDTLDQKVCASSPTTSCARRPVRRYGWERRWAFAWRLLLRPTFAHATGGAMRTLELWPSAHQLVSRVFGCALLGSGLRCWRDVLFDAEHPNKLNALRCAATGIRVDVLARHHTAKLPPLTTEDSERG